MQSLTASGISFAKCFENAFCQATPGQWQGREQRYQPGVTPDLADHHADTGAVVFGHRPPGERITCLLQQGGKPGVPGRRGPALAKGLQPDVAEQSAGAGDG